jgi:hypothetical protein
MPDQSDSNSRWPILVAAAITAAVVIYVLLGVL